MTTKKSHKSGNPRRDAPAAVGITSTATMPKFKTQTNSSVTIQHTEMFDTVFGGITAGPDGNYDEVVSYTIQPAWDTMFPWFSGIASRYERYRVNSLCFRYVPRVGTSINAQVVFNIDFDPDEEVPDAPYSQSTRQWQMAHEYCVAGNAWQPHQLKLDKKVLAQFMLPFYAQHPNDVSTAEPRTCHLGMLTIGVYGQATANIWMGDIEVSYDITLYNPNLELPSQPAPASALTIVTPVSGAGNEGKSFKGGATSATALPVMDSTYFVSGKEEYLGGGVRYNPDLQAFWFTESYAGLVNVTIDHLNFDSTPGFTKLYTCAEGASTTFREELQAERTMFSTHFVQPTQDSSEPVYRSVISFFANFATNTMFRVGLVTGNILSCIAVGVELHSRLAYGRATLPTDIAINPFATALGKSCDARRVYRRAAIANARRPKPCVQTCLLEPIKNEKIQKSNPGDNPAANATVVRRAV